MQVSQLLSPKRTPVQSQRESRGRSDSPRTLEKFLHTTAVSHRKQRLLMKHLITTSQIQAIVEHADQHCKDRGVRLTDKRKQILRTLISAQKPLSAYEVVEFYKENFKTNIPAMSVYRILDFLQEENLVHKLQLTNKYIVCAHIACEHQHGVQQFLICRKCQAVKEISIPKNIIDELAEQVTHAEYQLINPQLELQCLCKNCQYTLPT